MCYSEDRKKVTNMALLKFHDGFHGSYEVGGQTIEIGPDGVKPYDMTYGAVASCMYATFLDHTNEKGVQVGDVEIYIDGRKRTEIPTTLEYVNILMRVSSEEPEEVLKECMDLAMRDCSMVQTVYKVSEIEYKLEKM